MVRLDPADARSASTQRTGNLVLVGTCLGVLLLMALLAFSIARARDEAWANTELEARNVLRLLSQSISRNIEVIDLSLLGLRDAARLDGVADMEPVLRQMLLFDRASSARYLGSVLLFDADGNVVYDSGFPVPRQVRVADRDFFALQKQSDQGLYVSAPFESRLRDGDPSIGLSRRITNPDGSFGGIVLATLRLEYFKSMFSTVSLSPRSLLSIARADGVMMQRYPSTDGKGNAGVRLAKGSAFEKFGPREEEASFTFRSAIDGEARHYQFLRLPGLPLVLTLAFSPDDALAGWRRQSIALGALFLVISGALIGFVVVLKRALDRRFEVERALSAMASTDGLTGLRNRRELEKVLDRTWDQSARTGAPVSLLMIDGDHFKQVNDRHGHAAGDTLLRLIASEIAGRLTGPGQVAGRYGGEEFVGILPDHESADAFRTAERIRAAVANTVVALADGGALRATVSIGIATARATDGGSVADLVKRADGALYMAKADGRNRCRISPVADTSPGGARGA